LNDFALFGATPVSAYQITLGFGEKAIFTKLPSYSYSTTSKYSG
jgi:hypothetical protein